MPAVKWHIAIAATAPHCQTQAEQLAQQLALPLTTWQNPAAEFLLCVTPQRLELRQLEQCSPGPLYVDFLTPTFLRRIHQISSKKELIARAVGIKPQTQLRVIDATAGLGQDGMLLALLGCEVTLLERSPVIAALLQDGLRRARADQRLAQLSLKLLVKDALTYLPTLNAPDFPEVIYLDPMYPIRNKTALATKAMRYLRNLAGNDQDAAQLFSLGLKHACNRVVVKRPDHAPFVSEKTPDWQLHGKTIRFDVYRSCA